MMAPRALLVDDDPDLRGALATALRLADFDVTEAGEGQQALIACSEKSFDVVISDIRMPVMDGRQLLNQIMAHDRDLPCILITGHGDIEQAVQALRHGAYDFLAKPFATDRLIESARRAVDKRRLVLENRRLRSASGQQLEQRDLVLMGASAHVTRLANTIQQVGATSIDVLVEGEWGVGKRAVAQLLHRMQAPVSDMMRLVDCAALTDAELERLLFRTGRAAVAGRDNRPMLAAPGAAVMFDNIDHLSAPMQQRLLHALSRDYPIGLGPPDQETGAARGAVRIFSACSEPLADKVASGAFRSDLYYRIAPVRLVVPPLRQRAEDIPLLFVNMLEMSARRFERPVPVVSDAMLARLTSHDWPGNLHELQNVADQAVLNLDNAVQRLDDQIALPLGRRVAQFEAEAIRAALRAECGHIGRSCARLGIPRKTLYDKLARHGIDPAGFRGRTPA